MKPVALLFITLGLGACKDKEAPVPAPTQTDAPAQPPQVAPSTGEPTKAAPPENADDMEPPHPLLALVPKVKATKTSLEKLLPGYAAESEEIMVDEGQRQTVLWKITKSGTLAAKAYADDGSVYRVRIVDPTFHVRASISPGQTITATDDILDCGCVGEDGVDGFVCNLKGGKYRVVFKAKDDDCGLPSRPPAKALLGRKVIAISR